MQRARDAFWLYALENACNIAIALAIGRHSIGALTSSVSIAYSAAAVAALLVVRHRAGSLGAPGCYRPLGAIAIASALTAVVTVLASAATGWQSGAGLAARLAWSIAAGVVTFVACASWLSRRTRRSAGLGARGSL
jgi:hypothetical protein